VAVVKSSVGRGLASGIAAVVIRKEEKKGEGEKVMLNVVREGWTAV